MFAMNQTVISKENPELTATISSINGEIVELDSGEMLSLSALESMYTPVNTAPDLDTRNLPQDLIQHAPHIISDNVSEPVIQPTAHTTISAPAQPVARQLSHASMNVAQFEIPELSPILANVKLSSHTVQVNLQLTTLTAAQLKSLITLLNLDKEVVIDMLADLLLQNPRALANAIATDMVNNCK